MTPWRRASAWTAALAVLLAGGCSSLPSDAELRAARIERAVVPMARAALAAGQVETARRLYRRLLDVAPEAVGARMGLGDVALAAGRPTRAATWYLDAAARAPTRSAGQAAWLAHGRASVAAGDLEAARASFGRIADAGEGAVPALAAWGHNGLAVVAMLEGNPRGAVAAVRRAVLLAPDEQRFRDNLDRAVAIAAAYRPASDAPAPGGRLPAGGPDEGLPMSAPPVLAREGGTAKPDAQPPPSPAVAEAVADWRVRAAPANASVGVAGAPADAATASTDEPPDGESAPPAPAVAERSPAERDIDSEPAVRDEAPPAPVQIAAGTPVAIAERAPGAVGGPPLVSPSPPLAAYAADAMPEPASPDAAPKRSLVAGTVDDGDVPTGLAIAAGVVREPAAVENAPTESAPAPAGVKVETVTSDEPLAVTAEPPAPNPGEPWEGEPQVAGETSAGESAARRAAAETVTSPAEQVQEKAAADPGLPTCPPNGTPQSLGFVVRRDDGEYLQVGAFAVEANARRLAARLPGVTDLPVGIEPPGDDGLHRVRIGPLASPLEVPALLRALGDLPAA